MKTDLDYDELCEIGFKFFGPIIAPYSLWFIEKIQCYQNAKVLLFSREGYHFSHLFKKTLELYNITNNKDFTYLPISRSFIFHIMADVPSYYREFVKHPFRGTIGSFLRFRLCIERPREIVHDLLLLDIPISLPEDSEAVLSFLYDHATELKAATEKSRTLYTDYLRATGILGVDFFICTDIGFSGTIQNALSCFLNAASDGYYLFKSSNFTSARPSLNIRGYGFWSDNCSFGKGDILVDKSLFIESIFTAPHGQVVGIKPDQSFVYGPKTSSQRFFHFTYPIIDGIMSFITEMKNNNLRYNDVNEMYDVRKLYEIFCKYDKSRAVLALLAVLEIDDNITGNGVIAPNKFLPD